MRDDSNEQSRFRVATPYDRRKFLQAAMAGGAVTLAGCAGDGGDGTTAGGDGGSDGGDGGSDGGDGGDGGSDGGDGGDGGATTASGGDGEPEIVKVSIGNELGGELYNSNNLLIEAVTVNTLLYNTLMTRDPATGKLIPDAAASAPESNEDGTSFTFDLKEGVTFTDGTEMLAQDVKYSFEVIQEYDLAAAGTFDFESIEVEDDYRLTYNTKQSFAPMVGYTSIYFSIIQEGAADMVDEFPGGFTSGPPEGAASGPFTMEEYKPQSRARLVGRDDYHEDGIPNADEIHIEVIPEPSSQRVALEQGDVHVLNDPLEKDYVDIKDQSGIAGNSKQNPLSRMTIYLSHKPPFDNIHARKAVSYAINRKSIIENLHYGRGHTSTIPAAKGSWYYNEEADMFGAEPKPDMVRKHLNEGDLSDGFSFDLMTSGQDPIPDTASVIQQNLAEFDIEMNINQVSPGSFYGPIANQEYVAGIEYWNSVIYPGYYVTQLFADFGNYWDWHQWGKYGDTEQPASELSDVLAKARQGSSRDHRAPLLKEAQQILADQAVFVWLGGVNVTKLWREELENYDFVPAVWNNLRNVGLQQ
jgi:ABC-type transport system substrate-binding protein